MPTKRRFGEWTTWLEIGAVVFLVCAPTFAWLGCSLFWGSDNHELERQKGHTEAISAMAFDVSTLESLFTRLRVVPVVLFIMWRSGLGWSRFGLAAPKWKDLLIGFGLWVIVAGLHSLVSLAFGRHHPELALYPVDMPWRRGLLVLGECCGVGFAEELVMRAYLIPRAEAVLAATWKAALISVVVFGFAHLYKGNVGLIHSIAAGCIWTIAFCLTRRIWPLAISHAMVDFVVKSHLAALVGMLHP